MQYDYIIIGGGIVGLATAWQLQRRHPYHRVLLLEKESQLAAQQTGHNSGVIHSGIYYQPGSYKARFCQAGAEATVAYCREHDIPHRITGKLIVATDADESARLRQLFALSQAHGLAVDWLPGAAITELEPRIVGQAAIRVHATGIIDYRALALSFARQFKALGGNIIIPATVIALRESATAVHVTTTQGDYAARYLVVCGGLQSDRLAALLDLDPQCRIVPIRGEYYALKAADSPWASLPIYPVPQPGVPFLGVHITPMIDGRFTVGPNAVLAWSREGSFAWRDCRETLLYSGAWRMLRQHWRHALLEWRDSLFKHFYLRQVRKYCPSVNSDDMLPYPAGVRAQAVNRRGELINDFHFAQTRRSLHVLNAPSPAATAAIPIGAHLCDKLAQLSGDCLVSGD